MTSRRSLVTGVFAALAAPFAAGAQQSASVSRIGWLSNASRSPEVARFLAAFLQGLRELGYVEGQNVTIEYRFAEGNPERLPELAADLLRLKVEVIVTPNPHATRAAKDATRTIPIVMLGVIDPVGSGLVDHLARPGGNITGLSATAGPEIVGKYLELLRETLPKIFRVAVLRNPTNPDHAAMWSELDRAAQALGVQLQVFDAGNPTGLDSVLVAIPRVRADALVVLGDVMFFSHTARLAGVATKHRLPTISSNKEMASAGVLMTYGRDISYAFRRVGMYVDRILKGARPADLPIEQPSKFELVINLKTARTLGLTIPPAVLARADEVIQ
jgi:putative ABC transport system substrate-binding protein